MSVTAKDGVGSMEIELTVNGRVERLSVAVNEVLIDVLRGRLGLTGTKLSCSSEVCGACTVLIDDAPVSSCTYLAIEADRRRVATVEGLAGTELSPLQAAFLREGALQCGYCIPGQLMSATALLAANASPSESEITEWMRGNICRCGCYVEIRTAILEVAAQGPAARPGR